MYMVNNGENNNIFDESVVIFMVFLRGRQIKARLITDSTQSTEFRDSATCNTNSNPLKKRWYPQ